MTSPELAHYYEAATQELNRFVWNPGLDKLAALFGEPELPNDTYDRLLALQGIAATHWDFRKGAERQATAWDNGLLDQPGSDQYNTIFDAATQLGMVESSLPQNTSPDYLAILGGANRAPLDRLRYGLESVEDFGQVVYLGASRPVSDIEREKAKDYAPNAQTEFDLGCGAFETQLGAVAVQDIHEERGGDVWRVRLYEFNYRGTQKTGFVLSTPHTIGAERATTYDNWQFFADRAELAEHPGTSVVSVTTGFYVPGQHFPGVEKLVLPHGVRLQTIGHSAAYSGVVRKPAQLLQEVKAGLDAGVRLDYAMVPRSGSF